MITDREREREAESTNTRDEKHLKLWPTNCNYFKQPANVANSGKGKEVRRSLKIN